MSDIKLENNTFKVKNLLKDKAIAFLYEAGGELQAQVKRNTRVDEEQLKESWEYVVDESNMKVTVGSPLENAIWEEFGTGEYAKKNGRKGYWVFVKGSTKKPASSKIYTLKEAKQVMAILRSQGLEAYYTKGKKPSRAFQNAIDKTRPKLERRIKQLMGD